MQDKKGIAKIGFLLLATMLCIGSCSEDPNFPREPKIRVKSLVFVGGNDSLSGKLLLTLYFEDGDGDLGLDNSDTTFPFQPDYNSTRVPTNPNYYNIDLDFQFFDRTSQTFVRCEQLAECGLPQSIFDLYDGRFPVLNDKSRPRPISGELTYTIESILLRQTLLRKTLRLRAIIRDRALNTSNTVFTDTLTVR